MYSKGLWTDLVSTEVAFEPMFYSVSSALGMAYRHSDPVGAYGGF